MDGWKSLEDAQEVIADGKQLWDERLASKTSGDDTAEEPEQPLGTDPARDD